MSPQPNYPHSGNRQRSTPDQDELPPECIIKGSFYDEQGCMKEEIFLTAAEKASQCFRDMSQKSIRTMFKALKATERKIKTGKVDACPIKDDLNKFYIFCRYQSSRKRENKFIVTPQFLKFVEGHLELAKRNGREFLGFLQYLTSIMARMKMK